MLLLIEKRVIQQSTIKYNHRTDCGY